MINPRARPCEEGAIRSAHAVVDCAARQKLWVLVATVLASTIAYIDESVVNVALPAMERELGTSVATIQWVINAYTLCLAALLLVGGVAGDRFGRRRMFIIGVTIFGAASVWCGLSTSVAQLIAARATQGLGAALLIPCSLAIIGASFPESERGRAIGTWAGFSAFAAAVGPLLGGWIVDHVTWRAIFLVNPFLAIPTIWIALRHLPESFDPEAPPGIDWPGALLAFFGLGGVVFALIALPESGWRAPPIMAALALGLVLLVAFVRHEARAQNPMVPLDLFRARIFTGINVLTLLLYGALAGAFFLLPFELIQVHGYSATLAGAVYLPFTLIMGVLSRWSGGLLDRYGARSPLIVGPIIVAVGLGLLARPAIGGSYWTTFLLPMCVLGLGMAIAVAPLTTAVINAVPERRTGTASGINNAVATIATLLAVALFGAVVLGEFGRLADGHAIIESLSPAVRQAIEKARGHFVIESALAGLQGEDRRIAETILRAFLAQSIGLAMAVAAGLALAAAACAWLMIRPSPAIPSGEQSGIGAETPATIRRA